jgi:hypothetical protein
MLSAAAAPAAADTYNGHTYAVIHSDAYLFWTDAEAQARQMGGHLVTINDAAENDFVVGLIRRKLGTDDWAWIGLTDDPAYGGHEAGDTHTHPYPPAGNRGEGWVWVNGEPVTYENWHPDQPDNWSDRPSQNFAIINWGGVGLWDDYYVNETNIGARAAVVEIPSAQPPAGPTYEAEQALVTGAVVSKGHAGYRGSGFVDYVNAGGDAVEFTVQAPSAGWYDLSFRYANGGASDRAMALSVDGQSVSGGVTFARTGSWTQWRSAVSTVQLHAGSNTVRLTASGQSGPNLDSLTVRPSEPPTSGIYQAESAVLKGVTVASNAAGYTGSGFADYQHASGDSVEFAVDVPAGGAASLDFRYANGGRSDRPLELRVDGAVVTGRLACGPTGGWAKWNHVSQPVTLSAGRHTVRLTAIGNSGPNLDALTVRPASAFPQYFSTGFDTASLSPSLEDPDKAYVIGDGVIHTTRTGSDSFRRRYVRTKRADYFDNFVYEVTYSATGITFIGVGPGEPTAPFSEPAEGSLYLRLHGPTIVDGRVDVSYDNPFNYIAQDFGRLSTPGPHRARITRTGDLVRFEVDADATGPFTADFGTTVDLGQYPQIKAALAKESRLFFGNGEPESPFDNFSVRRAGA